MTSKLKNSIMKKFVLLEEQRVMFDLFNESSNEFMNNFGWC